MSNSFLYQSYPPSLSAQNSATNYDVIPTIIKDSTNPSVPDSNKNKSTYQQIPTIPNQNKTDVQSSTSAPITSTKSSDFLYIPLKSSPSRGSPISNHDSPSNSPSRIASVTYPADSYKVTSEGRIASSAFQKIPVIPQDSPSNSPNKSQIYTSIPSMVRPEERHDTTSSSDSSSLQGNHSATSSFSNVHSENISSNDNQPTLQRSGSSESKKEKPSTPRTLSKKIISRAKSVHIPGGITDESQFPDQLMGYLEKKGDIGLVKGWKRRFFCFCEDRFVYKFERDDTEIIGFVPLGDAESIDITPNSSNKGFQINTKHRIWFFRAENPEQASKWIEACKIHANYNEQYSNPLVYDKRKQSGLLRSDMIVKEDFLEKQHSNSWRKRYFLLKDGILHKMKSKNEKSEWKLILYHCKVEDETNLSETAFKISSPRKTVVFKASSESEKAAWMAALTKHNMVTETILNTVLTN